MFKFNPVKEIDNDSYVDSETRKSKYREVSENLENEVENIKKQKLLLLKDFNPNYLLNTEPEIREDFLLKRKIKKIIEDKDKIEEAKKKTINILDLDVELVDDNAVKYRDNPILHLTQNMWRFINSKRVLQKNNALYNDAYVKDLYTLFDYILQYSKKKLTPAQRKVYSDGKKKIENEKNVGDSETSTTSSSSSDDIGEGVLTFNRNDILAAKMIGHDNTKLLDKILKKL